MAPRANAKGWPAPAALEGIKSRKRPIFKAEGSTIKSHTNFQWNIPGIEIALDSRIAAVGEGAHAVVNLLLGKLDEEAGKIYRHPKLIVAHLSPQLAGNTAEAEQHAAAVAKAVQAKPHIIIIDEALADGGAGWARTFRHLIRDPNFAAYKGAVILACDLDVTCPMRRVCSELWACVGDRVVQQDLGSQRFQILEDALLETESERAPAGKKRGQQGGSERDVLIQEAQALSDFCFEEDVVKMARKDGWTMALLTQHAQDGSASLRGFLCYRYIRSETGTEMHIERLAVPKQQRGHGYANMLMQWILGEAARMPQSDCALVTCAAVEKVVAFYERFGFATGQNAERQLKEDKDGLIFMQMSNASLTSGKRCSNNFL